MWHSLLQEKTTSEFFQLSARARVLCCKNGVVLHKTYLAICTDANKSVSKGGALSSRNVCFQSHEIPTYRLMQSYDHLHPKSLAGTKPQITKSKPQVRTKKITLIAASLSHIFALSNMSAMVCVFDNITFR